MRRLPLIAACAFAATLAAAHVVGRAALPSIFRAASAHRWLRRHGLDLLYRDGRRGDVTVVGTSLSAGLAQALGARMPERRFVDRAHEGSRIADELAAAVLAEGAGEQLLLVELNPLQWSSERSAPLVTHPINAGALAGRVRRGLAWRLYQQLGVEGVLARAAEEFAPARLRVSGLAGAWRAPLLERIAGGKMPQPQLPEFPDRCRRWGALALDGDDLDVLDDFIAWLDRVRLDAVFYVPQLRRAGVAECGGEVVADVDRWIAAARAHVVERGHRFADFSRAVDESLLLDIGHVENDEVFDVLARAWQPELGRVAARP